MSVRSFLRLDASEFKKTLKADLVEGVKKAAQDMSNTFVRKAKEMGDKSAKEITKAMREEFRARQAVLRDQLSKGLIDRQGFRREMNGLKRDYNAGITRAMEDLRKQGRLTREEHTKLAGSLKTVGTVGRQSARQVSSGWSRVRAVLAGVAAILGARALLRTLGAWVEQAKELGLSYLRLSATAKLFGVEQESLNALAQEGVRTHKLTIREANELATVLSKLAARAGEVEKSSALMASALDLGAAQGLSAEQTAEALDQALRGLDEGTDKLFQKNPSQIYAEYAASIGTTAGKLTDVQQKQALVNAILTEGAKVQGEYGNFLQSDIGRLETWRRLLQTARETIGAALIPTLANLADTFSGPVQTAAEGFADWVRSSEAQIEGFIGTLKDAIEWVARFGRTVLDMQDPAGQIARVEIEGIQAQDMDPRRMRSRLAIEEEQGRQIQERLDEAQAKADAAQRELEDILRTPGARGEGQALQRVMRLGAEVDALKIDLQASYLVAQFLNREIGRAERPTSRTQSQLEAPGAPGPMSAVTGAGAPRARVNLFGGTSGSPFGSISGRAALPFADEKVRQLASVQSAVDAVTAAEQRLTRALLEQDAAGAAQATDEVARAKEELRARVAAVAHEMGGEKGIVEALTKALAEAGVEIETQGKNWEEIASTVEGVARGLLSVADAAGILDDQTRRILQGAVDVAGGVQRFLSGDVVGGLAQGIGGAIGLLNGLFDREDPEAAKIAEALEANRRALEENTQALQTRLAGSSSTFQVRGAIQAAFNATGGFEQAGAGAFFQALDQELAKLGLTRAEAAAVAADMGIILEDSTIAWQQFLEALNEVQLSDLLEDWGTRMGLLRREWELMGVTDPAQQMADVRKALEEFISPELAQQLAGVDFRDPEQVKAFTASLMEAFRAGTLDESLFGELDFEEFLQALQDLAGLGAAEVGGDFSRVTQIAGSITEVQANEFIAWLQDVAFNTRGLLEETRAIREFLAVAAGVSAAAVASAAPIGISPSQVTAGGVAIGSINVDTMLSDDELRRVGQYVGEQLVLAKHGRL